jgi:hypothetical protein
VKKLFLSLFMVALSASAVEKQSGASKLPSEALAAVRAWNPKFTLFQKKAFDSNVQELFKGADESPALTSGDFLGDGTLGYVMIGSDGRHHISVIAVVRAIVSAKSGWKVIPIEARDFLPIDKKKETKSDSPESESPIYVVSASGSDSDRERRLYRRDLIQIEAYGGAVVLYRLIEGRAQRLPLK